MTKIILGNILLNFFISLIFIYLNNWALDHSFEETFISLALLFGSATTILNAIYLSYFLKK
jgi:hypothetical protein